jgi:hypothetical protein
MEPATPSRRQILNEDLQIVHATLASIVEDVRHFSSHAAEAVEDALTMIAHAEHEFSPVPTHSAGWDRSNAAHVFEHNSG